MKHFRLSQMKKGWFVGAITPTAFDTPAVEVAIKHYKSGDYEPSHHHRIATELTAVIAGTVRMNGKMWSAGDIIHLEPFETTDFEAVSDAITVVVKVPCTPNDKYLDD